MGNQIGTLTVIPVGSVPEGCPHSGVVRVVTGTGRRAGQVYYETLVAGGGASVPAIAEMQSVFDITDLSYTVTIGTQPVSKSVANATANSFSVVASVTPSANAPALSYQWTARTGNAAFANLTNGAVYSNVATATLSIANTAGLSGTDYRVTISANNTVTAYSAIATLTVA